jgi:hypothetical protein
MKLSSETTALLNAKNMDLKVLASMRANIANVPVASANNITQEIGELLQKRLGTETTGQTEIDSKVQLVDKQVSVFIQLDRTVTQLKDLAGQDVDLSSLDGYFEVLKGKLKSAFDLSDDDFKFEETE